MRVNVECMCGPVNVRRGLRDLPSLRSRVTHCTVCLSGPLRTRHCLPSLPRLVPVNARLCNPIRIQRICLAFVCLAILPSLDPIRAVCVGRTVADLVLCTAASVLVRYKFLDCSLASTLNCFVVTGGCKQAMKVIMYPRARSNPQLLF